MTWTKALNKLRKMLKDMERDEYGHGKEFDTAKFVKDLDQFKSDFSRK